MLEYSVCILKEPLRTLRLSELANMVRPGRDHLELKNCSEHNSEIKYFDRWSQAIGYAASLTVFVDETKKEVVSTPLIAWWHRERLSAPSFFEEQYEYRIIKLEKISSIKHDKYHLQMILLKGSFYKLIDEYLLGAKLDLPEAREELYDRFKIPEIKSAIENKVLSIADIVGIRGDRVSVLSTNEIRQILVEPQCKRQIQKEHSFFKYETLEENERMAPMNGASNAGA